MHGGRPKKSKPVAMLWPPRLETSLRKWLSERYPHKDQNLLRLAAITIDAVIRDMLRADRGDVKVVARRVTLPDRATKHRSPVDALRRIQDAVKAGNHDRYAKAIAEAPIDVMVLIDQVRGSIIWSETVKGIHFPIPTPAAIEPYLPEAIALASRPGAWSGWRRKRTVQEIANWFTQITGERPKQSRKTGTFLDFLDGIEGHYNERLPAGFALKFGVQKSSRVWTEIFGG